MAQARCNKSNQSTILLGSDPVAFVSEQRGIFTPHATRERIVHVRRPVIDTSSNLGFRAAEGSSPNLDKPRSESTGLHRAKTQTVQIGGEHIGKQHWVTLVSQDYDGKRTEPILPVIRVNHFGGNGIKLGSDPMTKASEYRQEISTRASTTPIRGPVPRAHPNPRPFNILSGNDANGDLSPSKTRYQIARENIKVKANILTGSPITK